MKRPTPLPLPPVDRRPRRPPARASETGRAAGAPDAAGPVDDDDAARAASRDGGPALDAGGDPVRVRDVWQAARARRKALRAEVRRFTARARRRRAIWVGASIAVAALVLGSVGAAYSPLFAVRQVQIVGAEQLDVAAVQQALGGQIGTPLPLIDNSEIKAALIAFPLIESYSLEARPPHDLVLRIVERTPVGVVSSAAGFSVVDAAGVALATTPTAPEGQPVITAQGGPKTDAFAAIGLVLRSLPPSIGAQVTAASATSPDDVTLTLGGTNTQIVWGSAEESAKKAFVLEKAMVQRPPADVSGYDVSSPTAIVVW